MTTADTSMRTGSTRPVPVQPQDIKPRVTPAEGLRQTLTLAWRTLIQIRHNPWELGDFSIQPIIFVLLFLTFVRFVYRVLTRGARWLWLLVAGRAPATAR